MEFKEPQAIYLQIAEYICERILLGVWKPDEKILSVRELGVQLEVNPNTTMRAYEFLQNKEIIYNKRGIGFFVSADAIEKVSAFRRQQFLENDLPVFLKNMHILDININEIEKYYLEFLKSNKLK
ncbi:MAG: GntR family transcriptional regulator [Bacteroidota bacterium]